MQADPTEVGRSPSPWGASGVLSLKTDPGKQLLQRGSQAAPTRAGWGTPLSSLTVRHVAKHCELQKWVLAAFPWGGVGGWTMTVEKKP